MQFRQNCLAGLNISWIASNCSTVQSPFSITTTLHIRFPSHLSIIPVNSHKKSRSQKHGNNRSHERNNHLISCIATGTGNDPELSLITGGPEGDLWVCYHPKRQRGNETGSARHPRVYVPATGSPVGSHPDTQRNSLKKNPFFRNIRLFFAGIFPELKARAQAHRQIGAVAEQLKKILISWPPDP